MATQQNDWHDMAHRATARPLTLGNPLASIRQTAEDRLREVADEGKRQLAGTLDGLVQAAHQFADKLHDGAGGPVADYARRAADTVEGWQRAIHDTSVEELLDSGREIVRRSPAVALGVAVLAGFAAARLIKAGTSQ